MQMACQDLREQMKQAGEEGAQKISISVYNDDPIHCLRKEKESVAELIGEYINDLNSVFQDHLEEVGKGRKSQEGAEVIMEEVKGGGNGGGEDEAEGAEGEEEFKDAKETGSITSNISKTQMGHRGQSSRNSKECCSPSPSRGGRTPCPCRSWAW